MELMQELDRFGAVAFLFDMSETTEMLVPNYFLYYLCRERALEMEREIERQRQLDLERLKSRELQFNLDMEREKQTQVQEQFHSSN